MAFGGKALGICLGHEGRALMSRISVLIKNSHTGS